MADAGTRCPCGSGLSYGECCGALHSGARRAATAEQLMRSRYSAYAVGDSDYVLASWHPSTRPASAELARAAESDESDEPAEPRLVWRRLVIVTTAAGGPFDSEGTVEFRAVWRRGAERGELHERSRFVRTGGRWFYVDGELLRE